MQPLTPDDPREIGGFRLRSRLGAGGMGRVYLAFSPGGRAVAVKVVHPEYARDPSFVQRFGREVQAAQMVSGAFTAPVLAAGPGDHPPWLATAFVPGPSLSEVIAEAGPLPEAAVWRLAGGLAEALQAVHACGLVHRDLKPANVLLAADGPRLIDFGISRALDGTSLTAGGMVVGTPAYMSPEQIRAQAAGPGSDVFSLGGVLAFAATGRAPFGEGDLIAVAYGIVHANPELGGLPGDLRDLIAGCLAKDPAHRPTLEQVLGMVMARPDSFPGVSAAAFWPGPLAGLIGSRQDNLRAQAGAGASGDGPGRPVSHPPTAAGAIPAAGAPSTQTGSWPPGPPARTPEPAGAAAPAGAPRPFGALRPLATARGRRSIPMIGSPWHSRAQQWRRDPGLGVVTSLMITGVILAVTWPSHPASHTPAPAGQTTQQQSPKASPSPSQPSAQGQSASPEAAASALVCIDPLTGCTGEDPAQLRATPGQIEISSDELTYINDFTWSAWGTETAIGQGTMEYYVCPKSQPECTSGGIYVPYQATVTLTGLVSAGTGTSAYSRMVIKAPGSPRPVTTYTRGLVP